MAIQVRRGNEVDFDAQKMLPGEWAVSTDAKIVRMCFSAGVVVRMATYEAFEADMVEVEKILDEAKTVEEAVERIYEAVQGAVIDVEIAQESAQTATQAATQAAESATAAKVSETSAGESAKSAQSSADTANAQAAESSGSANAAKASAESAAESARNAEQSESSAAESASSAGTSEINARDYSDVSKSYAVGETGVRDGEDTDNAKYYYEQSKRIAQTVNGIVPMGTISFEELPTENIVNNAMYNISNSFTSDERFNDGGGVYYGAGNNVLWTAAGKWDVTASSGVTGIKGTSESTYRQGNVNISAANIGLENVNNTSDMNKPISNAQKKRFDSIESDLGTADISSIGDGTVKGAIKEHDDKFVISNNAARMREIGFDNDIELYISIDGTKYQIPFGYGRDELEKYLPLTGGTLSGAQIALNGGYGRVKSNPDATMLSAFSEQVAGGESLLNSNLYVFNHLKELKNLLQVSRRDSGGVYNFYNIFGEHNKPSGSYTGNGSATERTVDTGGLGSIAMITGMGCIIVTPGGCIRIANNSVYGIPPEQAKFNNGILTIASTDSVINMSGGTYYYQVL